MTAVSRQQTLVLVGIAGLFLLGWALHSGLVMLVCGLIGLTAACALLWGKYALHRVDYHRQFAVDRCFPGEDVTLTITVTNGKVLPVTHLTIDDTVPDELAIAAQRLRFDRPGQGTLRSVYGLGWYERVIRRYRVTPNRRGFYRLGPATLRGGDPFGYAMRSQQIEGHAELIVFPRVVPLHQLGIPTRRPFGDLRSRERLFEDPMRFAGLRGYQPGDPLNRIHWKATAVTGSLQVHRLDPSNTLGVHLFLNTWGFDLVWEGFDRESLETGCVVAASIAAWATEQRMPVGLYANGMAAGWGMNLRLPIAQGSDTLPHLLEGLARLQTASREPLHLLLLDEAPRISYGSPVVIITCHVADDLAAALLRVHESGRPVTLILVGQDAKSLSALCGIPTYFVRGEEDLRAPNLA